MLAGRSISLEKLDETVRRLDGLRASIQESEQVLALARARRGYGEVRAPFAGVIQAVMIHPGELAMAGKTLLELVGEAALKAVANIPQVDLPKLLGVILLTGPVVNNSIVLVDYVLQRRAEGASLERSVIDAVTTRYRPIMMTAFSDIAGMRNQSRNCRPGISRGGRM